MPSAPRVTVLMPVRDGARWLREAVDSVLAQTLDDLELVVVDDGSVDGTASILARYAAQDQRVRVLTQTPEGLVVALNRGLAAVSAPLVARLDADDVALPQRLERQVCHLDQHPEIALLGSWAEGIDGSGRATTELRPPPQPERLAELMLRINPFVHSSVIFRTAVVRDLGGYRAAFEVAEDDDLWLRVAEVGRLAILPESLVRYRIHRGSVTSGRAIRQAFSARLARHASLIRRHQGRDPALALEGPPDWWAPAADAAFYAEDARVYRFLELADAKTAAQADLRRIDLAGFAGLVPQLNHRERKLAQLAIVNLLRCGRRPRQLRLGDLLQLLMRLHPIRAFRLAWSAMLRP
jgi:glycosyltransferase involved in cell wall biosynthesis